MSAVLEAKTAMRRLATKAAEVVADDKLTQAEKKNTLDAIEADLKSHAETISLHEQAGRLMAGSGEAAPESKSTDGERYERKSFGQNIVDSDGYKSMLN